MTQSKELRTRLANECSNEKRRLKEFARARGISPARLVKFYLGELSLTPAELAKGLSV